MNYFELDYHMQSQVGLDPSHVMFGWAGSKTSQIKHNKVKLG